VKCTVFVRPCRTARHGVWQLSVVYDMIVYNGSEVFRVEKNTAKQSRDASPETSDKSVEQHAVAPRNTVLLTQSE